MFLWQEEESVAEEEPPPPPNVALPNGTIIVVQNNITIVNVTKIVNVQNKSLAGSGGIGVDPLPKREQLERFQGLSSDK